MSCTSSRAIHIACARAMMSRHSVLVMFFYMRLEKTCMQCHVSWFVDTWIIRMFVSPLACSCNSARSMGARPIARSRGFSAFKLCCSCRCVLRRFVWVYQRASCWGFIRFSVSQNKQENTYCTCSSAMSTLEEIRAQILANNTRASVHVLAISAIKASMPIQTLSECITKYQ
jgi:hypothetical protein